MPDDGRTTLRRHPERGTADRASAYAILDAALTCHAGVIDGGMPVVLPMVHGRDGDTLYLHGAVAGRFVAAAAGPLCVTVTLVDGLVLSRSAFGHSLNYRSVMVFGTGRPVSDLEERRHAAAVIVEHLAPGRSIEVRQPTLSELRSTGIVALPIEEWSAKQRRGDPVDPASDRALPIWAGVLPLRLTPGEVRTAEGAETLAVPPSVSDWATGRGAR